MPADPLDDPGSGDGVDDLERVFVVEHRSDPELTPDELEDRRRTKRIALWGLAVVAVVVAVSITLVALLVDTSAPPATPSAAAEQWARDLVQDDTAGRRALECASGVQGAGTLRLVLTAASGVRAGRARQQGRNTWHVPIRFLGPSGQTEASYTAEVLHRGGRYLVC